MIASYVATLAGSAWLMMQASPGYLGVTVQAPESALTEPVFTDDCELQKVAGGVLRMQLIQTGHRGYRSASSDVRQTPRNFRIAGPDAAEFADFRLGAPRTISQDMTSSPLRAEPSWPSLNLAGMAIPRRGFRTLAGFVLTPASPAAKAGSGQRFAATYYRGNSIDRSNVVATGFCIRTVQPQLPLSAEEVRMGKL